MKYSGSSLIPGGGGGGGGGKLSPLLKKERGLEPPCPSRFSATAINCTPLEFNVAVEGIRYLARQGIALQGHTELEGNFKKTTTYLWSHEIATLKVWIKYN